MTSCAVYLAENTIPVAWLRNTRKIFYIYLTSDGFSRISDVSMIYEVEFREITL